MPLYSFICNKCETPVEIFMSLQDYNSNQKCPTCKRKLVRDYQSDNVSGNVANRTLGALAEKNASKLSEDEKIHLHHKHNEYRYGPKKELPEGMSYIDREKPFHDQPRNKKSKHDRNKSKS